MKTYTWEKVELLNASSTASLYSSGITVAKIKFFMYNYICKNDMNDISKKWKSVIMHIDSACYRSNF